MAAKGEVVTEYKRIDTEELAHLAAELRKIHETACFAPPEGEVMLKQRAAHLIDRIVECFGLVPVTGGAPKFEAVAKLEA